MGSFKAAIAACHQAGAKVSIQLQHAGPEGNSKVTGYPLKSASAIPASVKTEIPEEISTEELYRLIEAYGDAALRAKKAGADAVEEHCAHGYLVSSFISERTNKRQDEFGGCFENRMRLARLIIENIRKKAGKALAVICRINASDDVLGGLLRTRQPWLLIWRKSVVWTPCMYPEPYIFTMNICGRQALFTKASAQTA